MITAADLIKHYQMIPHPEGGYFKETYRSAEAIKSFALPERFEGTRCLSTAIYFLLEQGNFSAFHRIKSDECWHFYTGGSMYVHIIYPNGILETVTLGSDICAGQVFQKVVLAGCWFASETTPSTTFSFAGCTVAPGFDFADFELAATKSLRKLYPAHIELITTLTR